LVSVLRRKGKKVGRGRIPQTPNPLNGCSFRGYIFQWKVATRKPDCKGRSGPIPGLRCKEVATFLYWRIYIR